jgi:hypothetical protein
MILYIKDPGNSTKILLELVNTFGNVEGYKIIEKKSVAFQYTKNEQAEKEIRKMI